MEMRVGESLVRPGLRPAAHGALSTQHQLAEWAWGGGASGLLGAWEFHVSGSGWLEPEEVGAVGRWWFPMTWEEGGRPIFCDFAHWVVVMPQCGRC